MGVCESMRSCLMLPTERVKIPRQTLKNYTGNTLLDDCVCLDLNLETGT